MDFGDMEFDYEEAELGFDAGNDSTANDSSCSAISAKTVRNSYNEFMSLYQDITSSIHNQSSFKIFREALHKAHQDILANEASFNPTNTGVGKVASLPELDHRKKDTRKKKLLSPAKRTKRSRSSTEDN